MIDTETIISQLLLLCEKAITSVDLGGDQHPLRHSMRSTGWPLVVFKKKLL